MTALVSFVASIGIGAAMGVLLAVLARRFSSRRPVTIAVFIAGLVAADALIGRAVFPIACTTQRGVQISEKSRTPSLLIRNSSASESIGDASFSSYLRQHGPFDFLEIEFGARDRSSIAPKSGTYRVEIRKANDPSCAFFLAADQAARASIARVVPLQPDECLAMTPIAEPTSRYMVELVDAPLAMKALGIDYAFALRITDRKAGKAIGTSVTNLFYRGGWVERTLVNPDGGGMLRDSLRACPVSPEKTSPDLIREVFLTDRPIDRAK
jgi:hypothetical protein